MSHLSPTNFFKLDFLGGMSFGPCIVGCYSVLVCYEISELAGQQRAEGRRNLKPVRFTTHHSNWRKKQENYFVFQSSSLLLTSLLHILHLGLCGSFEFESPNRQKCIKLKKKKVFLSSWPRTACGRVPA